MPTNPQYEVVSPVGEEMDGTPGANRGVDKISPAAPLADLNGKKFGLIWTNFRNGDVLLEAFADLLGKRYQRLEFVKLPSGRTLSWGDYPDTTLAAIARENGIDAAIVAPGC